ncbi:MAG: GGDEF domain-containing protein [Acidimicrobiales bacterium]
MADSDGIRAPGGVTGSWGFEDAAAGLRRWRERLPDGSSALPEDEARLVVESVLDDLSGGRGDNLDRAGRAWGRAHRSVGEMVGRLSAFREALAAGGVDDALRMHRALDRVTAAATEEVLERLERATRTDALTGVGNRRAFDETLAAALSAATRQGHDVTVVAVDLDGLKAINDTRGHAAGDAALLSLVRAFYSTLRDEDRVFRVGGDEFVILLPFASVNTAELLMERIDAGGGPAFTWGAAGYPHDGSDVAALVAAADDDLYRRRQAKRGVDAPGVLGRTVPLTSFAAASSASATDRSRRMPAVGVPIGRWAWIPAAAVLLASLIAAVESTNGAGVLANRTSHHSHIVTSPGSSSGATPNPATAAAGGTSQSNTTGPAFGTGPAGFDSASLTSSLSPRPTTGKSGGSGGNSGSGSNGGSGPNSGGSPGTAPPGGLLGSVANLVAPVPLVGGNNGLVAVVSQLLTGSPTSAAVVAPARPLP